MGVKVATASAVGLLALLSACTESNNSASPTSTVPPTTTAGTSESAQPSTGPAAGTCPFGQYEVSTISGKAGTEVNGIPIVAKSGGGLTLTITTDSKWTLSGDGATVTLTAADVAVEATVAGTAEGSYTKAGTDYTFRQEKATGKVTLKQPVAGISSLPMDDVGPALAPDGKATLTCGADTLKISSESVVLEAKRVGGGGPSTSTSEGGGGASGGGTLTINDSGQQQTIDCAARNVAINSSANQLTFTGSCGAVSVNGSRNQIKLDKVGQISVNGSTNTITWSSGNPKVSDNGTGNKISQG